MTSLFPKQIGSTCMSATLAKHFFHTFKFCLFGLLISSAGFLSAQCDEVGPDLDNDGVVDAYDADTDNDGIPDAVEFVCEESFIELFWDELADPAGSFDFDWLDIFDTGIDMNLTSNYPAGLDINMTPSTMDAFLIAGMNVNDINDDTQFVTYELSFSQPTGISSFIIQDIDNETRFTFTSYSDAVLLEFLDGNGNVLPQSVSLGAALSQDADGYITAPGQMIPVEFGEMDNWATYSSSGLVSSILITYRPNDGGGVSDPGDQFIAFGDFSFCSGIDTDGDGIPDFEDLDSDNDGIPDAIEACGDITLTLEDCTLDSNGDAEYLDEDGDGCSDGLVANYCSDAPIDTDGDGTPDYLDLDSDGDGCADNLEAVTDGFGTSEDTYTAGTVDNFGLLTSGISGDCPVPATTAYTDNTDTVACDEPTDPCELDGPDKDNDGVADGDDLDTDNDGIPDSVEFGCTVADTELFWDELADPAGSFDFDWFDIFDTGVDMNLMSHYPTGLDINMTPSTMDAFLIVGMNVNNINDASQFTTFELSFSQPTGISSFIIQDIDNETRFTFTSYSDAVLLEFLDVNGNIVPQTVTLGAALSQDASGFVTAPGQMEPVEFGQMDNWADYAALGTVSTIRITYTPNDGGGVTDPGDQFIAFGDFAFCSGADTDGDGVPDFEDLDSDNDGIPDAVEACGDITLVLEDCTLDSNGDAEYLDLNGDGCSDGLVANYCSDAPIDTDGDGTPDYLDLDSDGDGCADNLEAMTETFGTSEDEYIAGTVDECGLLTSGISGECPIPTTTDYTDSSEQTACVQVADLELTKTVSNSTPNVGDLVTYTITISNLGPEVATGVAVEDIVPNGLTNITNVSNAGFVALSTINWNALTIPTNGAITLSYSATVVAPGPGITFTNIAQVTASDQDDIDSTPNNDDGDQSEDDEDNAVINVQLIDLSLTKEVSDDNPNAGDIISYTITVSNAGPSAATGVAVEDYVPTGISNITNINNGGVMISGVIVWTGLTVEVGESITLTFDATVEAPVSGVDYLNIAQVTDADQTDEDSTPDNDDGDQSEDDEDSVEFEVEEIDLELDKSVSNSSPLAGDVVTYTIIVSNAGPNTATGVEVEDILPNGLTNISNIDNGGAIVGNTINWAGISIAPGGSISLSYDATVAVSGEGILYSNVAQVTDADQTDSDSTPDNDDGDQSEDDEDNEDLDVEPIIDLSLDKSVSNSSPLAGEVVTYTITVSNAGPNTASGVAVEDILPNGLTNISNIDNGGAIVGNVINWAGITIAPGASVSLTYDATVVAPAAGITYGNIAQVTDADQTDEDSTPGNDDGDQSEDDEDSEGVDVEPIIDLSLDKSVSNSSPLPGELVTYTITVSNAGPNTATGVAVEDIVPNGLTNISNIDNGGAIVGSVINWAGLSIAAGGSVSLTYDATVVAPAAGITYGNIAQVIDADQTDEDSTPGNDDGDQSEDDEDSEGVEPVAIIDLELTKSVDNSTPNIGETVNYTITVSNVGSSDATGVAVEDIIPNGLTSISTINNGGNTNANSIQWNNLSIQAGASISLTYSATVVAPTAGTLYVNVAQVTDADQMDEDSTPGNDDGDQSEDDEDNEVVIPVDPCDMVGPDKDNDGVPDDVDEDVDNDGIPNELEGDCSGGFPGIDWASLENPMENSNFSWTNIGGSSLDMSLNSDYPAGVGNVMNPETVEDFLVFGMNVSDINDPSQFVTYDLTFSQPTLISWFVIHDIDAEGRYSVTNYRDEVSLEFLDAAGNVLPKDVELGSSLVMDSQGHISAPTQTIPTPFAQEENIATFSTSELVSSVRITYFPNDGGGVVDPGDQFIAIGNVEYCTIQDTDGDGIPDFEDLDSDNDGIPDAIEACGDISLILEDCTVDSNGDADYIDSDGDGCHDGLISNYCTDAPIDTDGDGIPDFQDLDSDNDGCADNLEAVTDMYGTSEDTYVSTPIDECGLIVTSTGSGICMVPVNTSWIDNTDDSGCAPDVVCESDGPDKDNDGVADYEDIDTDNDGISDVIEGACEGGDAIFNWSTVANPMEATNFTWNDVNAEGLDMTLVSTYPEGTDNIMNPEIVEDYLVLGMNVSDVNDPNQFTTYELTLSQPSPIGSIVVHDIDNERRFSVTNYSDEVLLEFIDINGNVLPKTIQLGSALVLNSDGHAIAPNQVQPIPFANEDNWATYSTDEMVSTIKITYFPNDGGGVTNPGNQFIAIRDLVFCESTDTDGDGVPDFEDLDSDNDGIPDAVEACGDITLVLENCMLDANGDADYIDVDGDGCHDGLVSSYCAAAPIDTDGDGIPDFQDLDSDEDGCVDSVEAESTYLGGSLDTYVSTPVDLCGLLTTLTGSGTAMTGSGTAMTGSGTAMTGSGTCHIPETFSWIEADNNSACTDEEVEEECVPIGDFVWFDSDMNSIFGEGENGINGIKVSIYQVNGQTSTLYDFLITGSEPGTISSDGYWKTCVPPGTYFVEYEVPPSDLVTVLPNMGNDDTIDSDVTDANGPNTTDTFTVQSGDDFCDIGAGFYPHATLGDRVWYDLDFDGQQDDDEPGVEGVRIKVYNDEGVFMCQTTTDANGAYIAENLRDDSYYLEVDIPEGYNATIANNANEEMDSDIEHAFGLNTTPMFDVNPGQHTTSIDIGIVEFAILSVDWLAVDATRSGDDNLVSWTMSSDKEVVSYQVQRKLDSENTFVTIGELNAQGRDARVDYQYRDVDAKSPTTYYYRVGKIATDGTVDYSEIVSVTIEGTIADDAISIYPNPVYAVANIKLNITEASSDVNISLINYLGQMMMPNMVSEKGLNIGDHQFSIDVSGYSSGRYLIQTEINGATKLNEIIIVD